MWAGQLEVVRAFYDPLLQELYDHARARLADLDELVRLPGLSVARAVPHRAHARSARWGRRRGGRAPAR